MAAANMKAVKLRIKSVQNTMQITKAMQLVAASKLRKAKDKAMQSKPYLRTMKGTLAKIANENTDFQSPFTKPGTNPKRLFRQRTCGRLQCKPVQVHGERGGGI